MTGIPRATTPDGHVRSMTMPGVLRGFRDLAGAAPAVAAFGMAFGAAAVSAEVPGAMALLMSVLVFAGAAQYSVLELWRDPVPWAALAVVVLAVNGRHLILGASLADYLRSARPAPRWLALALLSDANWASTQAAIDRGERDVGHLLGGGLLLWTAWCGGTLAGVLLGNVTGQLHALGLDALMPAFFACALVGPAKKAGAILPLLVSGGLAVAALAFAPFHWAIVIGAVGGAAVWSLRHEQH